MGATAAATSTRLTFSHLLLNCMWNDTVQAFGCERVNPAVVGCTAKGGEVRLARGFLPPVWDAASSPWVSQQPALVKLLAAPLA